MKALLLLAFFFYCGHNVVLADPSELCRLLADGTQFRYPDSCNNYVTCHNQVAEVYTCATPSMYDRNKNQCVESASDCDKNYCSGVNGKWVANPNNCNGFYYCADGVAYPGYCENGFHFDESKQLCTFETTSSCFEVSNICEFLPDKTKIRDESNCATYYECSNGKKSSKTCKNTYFDVEKGECVDKSLVACSTHTKPSNVCGTAKKPVPGYKADGVSCRGYFYCQDLVIAPDLEPMWDQCPEGTFFNSKSVKTRQCVDPLEVDCTYNRCESRGTMYVQAAKNNCRNYIVCENGIEVEERTCSGDKFFDEKLQACVNTIISYPCCDGKK